MAKHKEKPKEEHSRAATATSSSNSIQSLDESSLSNSSYESEFRNDVEAIQSFGEPLHVSISRATTRFQTIQQAHSRQRPPTEDEEAAAGQEGFDLKTWLRGRQETEGPPFAKRFGLVFNDLSIYGSDVSNSHISTLITPLWKMIKNSYKGFGLFQLLSGMSNKRRILSNISGEVKEGEMLLVLGRPGSGCSTLLRVLGNHRNTYTKITGSVSYGGLTPEEVRKHYRGEVAYNQEDDMHSPTLTVRKTLDFAITCKTPSKQVLDNAAAYHRDMLDMLLDIYGLTGCADTIVGNAFLRGVSGGERKRVSIAEQVASGASVEVWDGSTRGLDSSSALDYVRSLRINADVLQKSIVATIYQASESIYKLFDKVMVIDEGRQLYFGPADKAVAYFERIGIAKPARQTTSDFLTGLTRLNERRVRPGWEDKAPVTAEEFEKLWLDSPEYQNMYEEVEAFEQQLQRDGRSQELREFVDRTKMGTDKMRLRRKSPYTTTFVFQLQHLLSREWDIFTGNRAEIIFKFFYNIAFAIIVGTLFIRLPRNTSSYFTRGGVLFFALLFNSLTALAEIPRAVTGRQVVYKHKALALYHPAALSLAQTVVDIPFMVVQILLFGSILYWATFLQRTGGHFLAFLLFLFMGCLCLTAFFRLIGNISPNVDVGHTISGICLLFLILYVGYLIPPGYMHHYFKWIYWTNPLAYGFKALASNEYRDINFPCAPSSLVPRGDGIDIANQVCTIAGAQTGQLHVRGRDYLEKGYHIHIKDQWKDFIAVTCYWVVFVLLIACAMEFLEFGNTGYTTNVYKRYPPNVEKLTETSDSESESESETNMYADIPEGGPTDEQIIRGTTYTWKDVNYTVPVKGGERQLLHNVSGYIKPGTMTALMGSSGAGKTTLLDSLSQRKTIGKLEGEMLMNGAPQPVSFRRITGYCEQLDVHNPHATVREALRFSAALRRSARVSSKERDRYVEYVIELLGLGDIADCLVGDPESSKGISLEERKRLTIGVELVAKPKILFLDEPTSGLDAQASYSIVQFMRKLAADGQTILCTIHQPSALLFEQFDRLLLLVRGGHTVYFGDIGPDAETLIDYFESHGAEKCPSDANPAEYILDVVGSRNAASGISWPEIWSDSDEKTRVISEVERINQLKQDNPNEDPDMELDNSRKYARLLPFQLQIVTRRMLRSHWRDQQYNLTRLALQIICALAVGFSFIKTGDGTADTQNKIFAIFETAVLSVLVINQVQPQFLRQRLYYSREASTNQYGWEAFSFAIIVTEWPFAIFSNTVFFVCFYWLVGLNSLANRTGYFYIAYVLLGTFSLTLGQAIAAFSPNDIVASMLNPIFTTMMTLFCGVTIPYLQMPLFWRRWMYWLSPYTYFIEGVITNDLYQTPIRCKRGEFFNFTPPSGQSCQEFAGDWLSSNVGYIRDISSTTTCEYCPYSVGEDYYRNLNWSFSHRWRNWCILLGFTVFNILFTVFMVRIYKVNKR
ncbi:ATP-binding cassette transporter snq2 [Coemansia sp. RSA 1722]|nr:ATP-binding cassette transporter snq2 [Coemansia sp. RSA 485]KAJ2601588.1 ATP-binding cassette transporter snq2 [Coemansia sp. RSA 1721]KAJ2605581.1 ATP-binding cassette transporter snq2 [Coemansia sp. RSA 1722]KAJ2639031.1 ATP-binding cassette transporter snq2 [Coemansia sp. RSA 1286]